MLIENKKYKNQVLITLLVVLLVLLFEIIPTYAVLISTTFKIVDQNSEIERIKESGKELDNLKKQIKTLKIQMYNSVSDYKDSRNLSTIINLIDSLSRESKMKNIAIKPGEIKESNQLWLQPIEINLTAEYENIYNFIRFLENTSHIIIMKELKLKPLNAGITGLSVDANFEIYLNI